MANFNITKAHAAYLIATNQAIHVERLLNKKPILENPVAGFFMDQGDIADAKDDNYVYRDMQTIEELVLALGRNGVARDRIIALLEALA